MFSRITILNGTEIDRQERYGAEVDYIKMFGLDYFALKKGEEHAVAIPRYEALVEIHGPPDESELSGRDSNMDDMFLHLSLEYAQDSRSKKVTKTMTVKALKILAKKLFKAPNIKDMELFYTSQKSRT
ncbi:Uncharacterized protein FKW44_023818 [Caligus rogercresseyi]|uniref:Uncharacterized protein n=1 Tax=Caligus rogercresseyi TaxID=217165 RepID=A0A7T8GPI5_CALRO|nr:Uncharacterized protein FKW44_023818 [Caligus rogercresseyi]